MASSDFSWLALFLAGLVTVAQAYTQPTGNGPVGNSILTPSLNQAVPVGKPFEITWDPTTPGTVTLLLLHGPSNNLEVMYPIVEKIPNTGKYAWTPKTDIAPEATHYGIQLICDSNGQYQWSTQFGISNPGYSGSQSSSGSSASIHVSATTSSSASASGTETANTISTQAASLTSLPTLTTSTGFPIHNSSIVHSSGSLSTLKSAKTTATAKHSTVLTSALSTTPVATSSSTTSSVSTASEAMAAMYTAAGGVVALAAAAVFAL